MKVKRVKTTATKKAPLAVASELKRGPGRPRTKDLIKGAIEPMAALEVATKITRELATLRPSDRKRVLKVIGLLA